MHRLSEYGEQTAIALATLTESALSKELIVELPCSWNWQVDLFWFSVAKWNLPRKPVFKHRALLANMLDPVCHEPPRLLRLPEPRACPEFRCWLKRLACGATRSTTSTYTRTPGSYRVG